MKALIANLAICAVLGVAVKLNAQTVTVDPVTLTLGYLSWSPVATDAPGYGGTGSSAWLVPDLPASFSGSTLTLNPNVYAYSVGGGDYWVNADGSGADLMDAIVYDTTSGVYVGTTLTLTYDVLANTLTGPYSSDAFIRDFNSTYTSYTESTVPLTPGVGSVSLLTSANPGDNIQYGFELIGPDTNPASAAASEEVIITPVPEPFSLALIGLGIIGVLVVKIPSLLPHRDGGPPQVVAVRKDRSGVRNW